jgi:glycosyl transferase family 7 (putative galactosyltransferase)
LISIVVSWRNRGELAIALPSMLSTARLVGGEVTIVDYGGNEAALAKILATPDCQGANVERVDGERYFNKSRAQNMGAGATCQPVLFFCDCDIVLEPSLVAELAKEVQARDAVFATLAGVVESQPNSRGAGNVVCFGYQLNIRLANGRQLRIVDHEEDAEDGCRQAPGLLLVRRADFLEVRGYNGRLHGWGWEDQDMIARLTLYAGLTRIQRGVVKHLSHGEPERISNYPPVRDRWESRDRMFRQALASYDANDFFGTYYEDNATLRHAPVVRTLARDA